MFGDYTKTVRHTYIIKYHVYRIEHNNNNNIVHNNGRFALLTFCRGAVTRYSTNTLTLAGCGGGGGGRK